MNSLLLVLLHTPQCHAPTRKDALGKLHGVYDALHQHSGALDISRHYTWVMLVSPWPQPFRRHDLAELAQHVVPRLRIPALQGCWQARRFEAGHCRSLDTGPVACPIPMVLQGEDRIALTSGIPSHPPLFMRLTVLSPQSSYS